MLIHLLDFCVTRNGSYELPEKQLTGEPPVRLFNADTMGLKMTNIMFHVGPTRVTVSDCWTLILPGFEPDWLVDKVPACLYSHIISFLIL